MMPLGLRFVFRQFSFVVEPTLTWRLHGAPYAEGSWLVLNGKRLTRVRHAVVRRVKGREAASSSPNVGSESADQRPT